MTEQAGFKVGEIIYPVPQMFRAGDFVLIRELTTLESDEFAERFDRMKEDETADILVIVGLLGVAVWQANPNWSRDRVLAFVNKIDMEQLDSVGGDADPPAEQPDEEKVSPGSSNGSTTTPAGSLEARV